MNDRMGKPENADLDAMERGEVEFVSDAQGVEASQKTSSSPSSTPEGDKPTEANVGHNPGWFKVRFPRLNDAFVQLGRLRQPNVTLPHIRRKSIVRNLDQGPPGYPRLAAFLDSDENFMLYRRYGFLQSRILLHKQDELREMEWELDHLDGVDAKTVPKRLWSRERDGNERRKELLSGIEAKFKEYAELLVLAQQLASFNKPLERDYLAVKNWFEDTDPVCNVESYIFRKEDIVTLKPGRDTAWLDRMFEKVLQRLSCRFIRFMFCSPDNTKKVNLRQSGLTYFSRERVEIAVSVILTVTILTLLIVPVYVLWRLSCEQATDATVGEIIGVLLVFTVIFSAVLSLFTRAKRHEILASAAAYCAVLVVFVGNVGQLSTPGTS